jgi:hypothetical protein
LCDASGFGLGGVLLQNKRVILFDSRAMTPAERNYGVGEHELLAVVHALKVWRCYLKGCPNDVIVCTDQSPNTYLPTKANLSRRQTRWSEYLQKFKIKWKYQPGRVNVADPLSRRPHLVTSPLAETSARLIDYIGTADQSACYEEAAVSGSPGIAGPSVRCEEAHSFRATPQP